MHRVVIQGCIVLALGISCSALADDVARKSVHVGFLYPNGVDVVGYTVESKYKGDIYTFFTFGIPSFAALGLEYCQQFNGNGMTASIGIGIGSIMYGSIAYQWRLDEAGYLKVGAGYTTGVAYTGSYPVVSYEYRFLK